MSETGVYLDVGAMCLVIILFFFALAFVVISRLGVH